MKKYYSEPELQIRSFASIQGTVLTTSYVEEGGKGDNKGTLRTATITIFSNNQHANGTASNRSAVILFCMLSSNSGNTVRPTVR